MSNSVGQESETMYTYNLELYILDDCHFYLFHPFYFLTLDFLDIVNIIDILTHII